MKQIKKTTVTAQAKMPVKTAKATIQKMKSIHSINFPIKEDIDFEDFEIRIAIKGNEIIAKFLLKGTPISEQVLPVKKIPNPPPMPNKEIIKALEQLRLSFNTKK
jgi:hypothetical protein